MKRLDMVRGVMAGASLLVAGCLLAARPAPSTAGAHILRGEDAFANFRTEKPGTFRQITVADLPRPYATKSATNDPKQAARPENVWPIAPQGFEVQLYARGLDRPREIRRAPNGDLFVADSYGGKVLVFRGVGSDGKYKQTSVFASGLTLPFGIAFYPLGANPKYVYVGNTNSVVRFPYRNGDLKASGSAEIVVAHIPGYGRLRGGGHWTRDLAFSPDGSKLFIAVGSKENIDNTDNNPVEYHRANILVTNPDGSEGVRVYASGIRNPVGIAVNPQTGELWASVNERDDLGNNLPPDYITHIRPGGFYGWPWYYIGGHQDPRLAGKHPELRSKVIVPDVLLQPHNASLEMAFYEAKQFPTEYRGDAFAAEHGSWNKAIRAGYEVICVPMKGGHAVGDYEDFLTGFVLPNGTVWGRPVGVAVGKGGSLYVTDDGSGSIWRVSYRGR
ncbi:MAG: PQQ-dependent sugar dehydrogenase [Terriglobia bacterium]